MKVKVYQFVALTLVALVLGTAASLVFSTSYTPAYAQAEDGILNDLGEGENRVLGTEWRTLQPGQQITFQFDYDGSRRADYGLDECSASRWRDLRYLDGQSA